MRSRPTNGKNNALYQLKSTCAHLQPHFPGGSSPTAANINEPSISYSDFLTKLQSDQVSFVSFLAPNGDVAYATLKQTSADGTSGGEAEPIRIGEGYPLEVSFINFILLNC